MFDTARPDPPILQFVSFQVAPLADGGLSIAMAGTYLDESDFQFLNDDVESLRVSTIGEAVSLIRNSLVTALKAHLQKEKH
jgi:hypothetical protein